MATRSERNELNRLLELVEDYFRDGFRRERVPESPPGLDAEPDEVYVERDGSAEAGPAEVEPPTLGRIAAEVAECRRCGLHRGRRAAVPGEGVERPLLLVVGEGPGADEDRTGRPFVGPAGQYLDKWLEAIGLSRERNCFIANVVKCRPPGNRDPLPEERAACLSYLERQVELLQPRAILTVGRISSQVLSGRETGIGALRGQVYAYRGIPLVPTYHPSAVLRDSSLRRAVWEDLKRLQNILDERA